MPRYSQIHIHIYICICVYIKSRDGSAISTATPLQLLLVLRQLVEQQWRKCHKEIISRVSHSFWRRGAGERGMRGVRCQSCQSIGLVLSSSPFFLFLEPVVVSKSFIDFQLWMITLQEFRFYVSVYKIVKLLVIDKYTRKACSVGVLGVLVTVAAAVAVCVCVCVLGCVCSCRSRSRAALRPKLSIPII